MEQLEIIKVRNAAGQRLAENISQEIPLTVEVNGDEIATLLCSPDHLSNLVTGFLFTSGVISALSSLKNLILDRERFRASAEIEGFDEGIVFKRVYTSGCGKGVIFHNPVDLMQKTRFPDGFRIDPGEISALMKEFIKGSPEHAHTRGVHSSALADRGRILIFRDDIGRHNAMDKVLGEALAQGMTFSDKILLTTGRVSSEILSKSLRTRTPVIAALGSPTNQAVKLARLVNLTLISHVRGNSMDVYSGENRLNIMLS